MKSKSLLGLAIALFFFAACKKNDPITEPLIKPRVEKPDPLELLKDSASYTIDGQKIILTETTSRGVLNGKANKKLDSVVKNVEYISDDQNTVLFGRFYSLRNDNRNNITITFLKKYNKSLTKPNPSAILFEPVDKLDLFSIGERKFAMDFTRNNSQNGIALELGGNDYRLQTYGYSSLVYHPLLNPELQSQSKFEILSLQKLKSGKYLIEAKFNASVYHGDGTNIKKIENGYLRLRIDTDNPYF
ncbi:hypothetical protein SAMN05421827_104216 [Pedobacter terrae]|uniref:Uncharacterized protein n=1 Tax=Pedobacter terrae TaxID=405671 RepID=A0A1G7SJW7_9SPHI|nr:hypothetical protein [Pedobacter terrae]SDG23376.1 hypothetical protein SAMN05421827_104216 [Pedobacter terrae]